MHGLRGYYADRFNRLDLPAALFTVLSTLWTIFDVPQYAGPDSRALMPGTHGLRSIAVLLLWMRAPRLFLLSTRRGPLVLMLFRMFTDVISFLVLQASILLAFAAAFVVLFERPTPDAWPWGVTTDLYDERCEERFGSYVLAIRYLAEAALTSEPFLECGRGTHDPTTAYLLAILFYVVSGLLLLNMLIAMMAKTFDNVWEASEVNHQFLFARQFVNQLSRAPEPPPAAGTSSRRRY